MSLPRHSINRPVAVAMVVLAVLMLGVISLVRLPIDLLPDIAYPKLVVSTGYVGVAPAEVERFITEPIEQQVSAVPGVQRVESVSREGISLVTLRFAWGTNMNFAALNVREKLDNLGGSLPTEADRPVVLRTDPTSEPIMAVSVSGRGDLWTLKNLAESVIKRRLEQIDGVAQALVTGGLEREIHVDVDPERLESYGLTIAGISSALKAANQNAPGGTVLRGRARYSLRTLGEFQSVQQIGDVVLGDTRTGAGAAGDSMGDAAVPAGTVTLSDVATIEDGYRERESIARYNGTEAVGLLLFKESGANTVRVAKSVNEVLAQLRAQYPDIQLDVATSQAGFISNAISNVVQEVIVGGILAFLVLFLFLRDPRYPVAIALVIPISVVATFALFDAANISLNIMSLGGLALGVGLLMDNSIVVVENIFRNRELGRSAHESAAVGAEEVQRAIIASTLTTIAVFGPIIYVQGVAGKMFAPLSLAVAFSLSASVLVAITLLPVQAARWSLDGQGDGGRASLMRRLGAAIGRVTAPPLDAFERAFARFTEWYERSLLWALRHHAQVVIIALLMLAVTIGVGLRLNRSVLPKVDQGTFRAHIQLPLGTSLAATADAASRLETLVRADSAVDAVFTRIGRQAAVGGAATDAESGINSAVLDVHLRAGQHTAHALERLRPQLATFPPGAITIETGQATELGQLLGGSDADVAVRIRGNDLDAALAYAHQVETRLHGVRSLTNVRVGSGSGHPEVRVEINREAAASYGIEPQLVAQTVEAYMHGTTATDFVAFDRKVPVIVRLPEKWRQSLETLRLLKVKGVPLRELVTTHEGVGPAEIRRVDQSRVVPVYADVASGGVDQAVTDIRAALAGAPAPSGLRVDIGGENEELHKSFRALGFAFVVAVLLVYMILAAEFESLLHPFIVLLSVPLGLAGAVLALWVTGTGLNTVSLIGMVVLVGIVDNDAVVKVDFINQMRRQGMSIREAIIAAGHARFRPILINSITAILGLLPMALGVGAGGALQAPLAVAVLGGLFSATALTLIVVPVAYEVLEGVKGLLTGQRAAVAQPAAAQALMAQDGHD